MINVCHKADLLRFLGLVRSI